MSVAATPSLGAGARHAARRLVILALVSFFLLLTGSLIALILFERYQPLDSAAVIRSFSLGLPVLWVLLAWKTWEVVRSPRKRPGARLGLVLPALVPWAFAAFLWLNGALDRSPPRTHVTTVVTKHVSSRDWVHLFRYEVVVHSWREGHRFEGILVRDKRHFEAHQRGDAVRVEVRSGFFGLVWIAALTKEEKEAISQAGLYTLAAALTSLR